MHTVGSYKTMVDADLPERVARGLGGQIEADQVRQVLACMQRYEKVLLHIAVHGDAASAMLACRVMAGSDPWADAAS